MKTTDITGIYKEANRNWGSRIFAFVLIGLLVFGGTRLYPLLNPPKPKTDCSYFEKQNAQLVNFIMEIKSQEKEIGAVFLEDENGIAFAVYDTTKKPLSQSQMQQRARYIEWRIDSLMRQKQKQDSIYKSKN